MKEYDLIIIPFNDFGKNETPISKINFKYLEEQYRNLSLKMIYCQKLIF